jgi:hypothetical protein
MDRWSAGGARGVPQRARAPHPQSSLFQPVARLSPLVFWLASLSLSSVPSVTFRLPSPLSLSLPLSLSDTVSKMRLYLLVCAVVALCVVHVEAVQAITPVPLGVVTPGFHVDVHVNAANQFEFSFFTTATIDATSSMTVKLGGDAGPSVCVGLPGDMAAAITWTSLAQAACPASFNAACSSYKTTYSLAWLMSQGGTGCGFATIDANSPSRSAFARIAHVPTTADQTWMFTGKIEATYWLPSRTWLIYAGNMQILQTLDMTGLSTLNVLVTQRDDGITSPDSAQVVTSTLVECNQPASITPVTITAKSSMCLEQEVQSNLPFRYNVQALVVKLCAPSLVRGNLVWDCTRPLSGPFTPATLPLTNPSGVALIPSSVVLSDGVNKKVQYWVTFPEGDICFLCRLQSNLTLRVIESSIPGSVPTPPAARRLLASMTTLATDATPAPTSATTNTDLLSSSDMAVEVNVEKVAPSQNGAYLHGIDATAMTLLALLATTALALAL